MLKGVMADNIANDSSDMVNSIASESVTGQSASTRIDSSAVIDTMQTSGDHGEFNAVAMHSVQYRELQKQQLIDFIPDARGEVNIPTYMGMRVIVDDSLTPRAGTTDGFVYNVYLFNAGAFVYGIGMPKVPTALERNEDAGNGGGEEIIYSRQTKLWHPNGFQFTGSSLAGNSATYAELATAASMRLTAKYRIR